MPQAGRLSRSVRYSIQMRAMWRSLLLCCLALALPLHGLAATRMALCHLGQPGGPQAGGQVAVAAPVPQAQPGHHHHFDASAADAAHHSIVSAVDQSSGQDHSAVAGAAKSQAHQCSACASCCAAAALLNTATLATSAAPAAVPMVNANVAAFHFAASGPDRPPRPDLA